MSTPAPEAEMTSNSTPSARKAASAPAIKVELGAPPPMTKAFLFRRGDTFIALPLLNACPDFFGFFVRRTGSIAATYAMTVYDVISSQAVTWLSGI
jgi:hypothetical protein